MSTNNLPARSWGFKVSKYGKSIAAFVTSLITVLVVALPLFADFNWGEEVYVWIASASAVLVTFNVWLTANLDKVVVLADQGEALIEALTKRNV